MLIKGVVVDKELVAIKKSITNNLKNKNVFQSINMDAADNTTALKPPIAMSNCLYVFQHSSHVAKASRILASDIIYNDITLTPSNIDEADEHLINQVQKINKYLNDNIDELYNLAVDYNYAGWGAVEYVWNNTRFSLKQIPIHSCNVVKTKVDGVEVFLLEQKINSKTKYFRIMGETYPDNFIYFNNNKLSDACLIGGDNIYAFFSIPRWAQNYDKILTEIAISKADYNTVANGNISSGILNINLEPQLPKPPRMDEHGKPITEKSREEIITEELQSANGGTAVIFTESNKDVKLDYVSLTNNNYNYLSDVSDGCRQAVLNDYNIPLARLMENTEKESMNSDKTKSIWEIYCLNLKNEQKPFKLLIRELVDELYRISVDVNISVPVFSDRRETEVKLIIDVWNNGGFTLQQYITALSNHIDTIDLNDYDFTVNSERWSYRKIPELDEVLSLEDEEIIASVETQLKGIE